MEAWEREYHVSRIISGRTRCRIDDQVFRVVPLTREQKYTSNEIYRDTLDDSIRFGLMSEAEIVFEMRQRNVWTDADEAELAKLTAAVEDMKVGLYEHWFQSAARQKIRLALDKGKAEVERLESILHGKDHLTQTGVAMTAKARYLIGSSLILPDGTPYWTDFDGWNRPDVLIDAVIEKMTKHRLRETGMRELARSEPWRSTWSSREHCGRGLFDIASVDMTDDQKNLILWSGLYDSVRDHPDAPAESILDDDDMLDGWLIIQRRKREAQQAKKKGDDIQNPKIRDAQEIFFMADSIEDAKKIDQMNDHAAKNTKAMRMAHLRKHKEVNEMRMPDTWQRFQMEYAKMEAKRMKGQ